jgi:hypothetical protein
MTSDVFAMIVVGDRIFAANESNGLAMSQDDAETWNAANLALNRTKHFSFAYIGTVVFAGQTMACLHQSRTDWIGLILQII